MEWLLHCNSDTLRKIELHLPCSISVLHNYVILKLCNWNIMSKVTLVHREKINLEVTLGLSFQGQPLFLSKDKLAKCTLFLTERCFTHPPLIFAARGLIITLKCIKFGISLLAWSLWKHCIFSFHKKFFINSELFCGSGQWTPYVIDIYIKC